MQRTRVLTEAHEAVASIRPGDTVGIGGSLSAGHPMALIRSLIRHNAAGLRIVAPTAGLDLDFLIASGIVDEVVTAYAGAEGMAPTAPLLRQAVQSNTIRIWEADEAHCVLALRAAAQRLPFLPTRAGLGTSLPDLNPHLVPFLDPITAQPLLAVPAIPLDVALIAAEESDAYGNVRFAGATYLDLPIAAAARRVVVQVEREVTNESIRAEPSSVRFWPHTQVVIAPYGTHPFSSRHLAADTDHLSQYVRAASDDDPDAVRRYLHQWVRGPQDHGSYLRQVGDRRIKELMA